MKTILTLIVFTLALLAFIFLLPDTIPVHKGEIVLTCDALRKEAHRRAIHDIACSQGHCERCHYPKRR